MTEPPRVSRRLFFLRGWSYDKIKQVFPEVRERAVRMVLEHECEHSSQWLAVVSIAAKIGCSPETLQKWERRTEADTGWRGGLTSDERARIKELDLGDCTQNSSRFSRLLDFAGRKPKPSIEGLYQGTQTG